MKVTRALALPKDQNKRKHKRTSQEHSIAPPTDGNDAVVKLSIVRPINADAFSEPPLRRVLLRAQSVARSETRLVVKKGI
jgi:hypothetical protein